ncbi:hypothetical protein VPH35_020799 [Triticum aestivum]
MSPSPARPRRPPLLPHAPSLDPVALHLHRDVAGPADLSHRPYSSTAATEGAAAAPCAARASPASPSRRLRPNPLPRRRISPPPTAILFLEDRRRAPVFLCFKDEPVARV